MKKSIRVLSQMLCLVLLLSLLPTAGVATAEGTHPVIAMTQVPAYNEGTFVQGIVFREDGGEFEPNDYRITVYLQVNPGEPFWVKPYDNQRTTQIGSDGSFSVTFVTGDYDAVAKLLVVMLIPADYSPNTYSEDQSAALDTVMISRSEDGTVTIDPDRTALPPSSPAPSQPPLSSGLSVSAGKIAFDIGFHTDGSYPGNALSESLIRQHLSTIAPYCDAVRFYSAGDEVSPAYAIANEMGFKVLGSAWLSKDKTANQNELDALIAHCNAGQCCVAIVGSETLLRGDLSPEELIEAINYVRDRLVNKNLPVTTADSFHILTANPSVCNACNLLMANCYPFWSPVSIDEAQANFTGSVATLYQVNNGKEIIISETGWPTRGGSNDSAVAGEDEAARYYSMVRAWSLQTGINVLYFESAEEEWKRIEEGEFGGSWGFFTGDFTLKDCYSRCNPFGIGGTYGADLVWALEDGVLTLSLAEDAESGEMAELAEGGSFRDFPWYAFAADITAIEIEEGVVSVAACAFGSDEDEAAPYANVTALTLPDSSLTGIGAQAFRGCPSLSALIPATVLAVGAQAFEGCEYVRFAFGEPDFILPGALLAVEAEAFAGTDATSISLPDGCEELGEAVFADCTRLRRVRIPESVTEIHEGVFDGCGELYVFGAPESGIARFIAESGFETIFFLPEAETAESLS